MRKRVSKGPSEKTKAICSLAIAIHRMIRAKFTWAEILGAVFAARKADRDTAYRAVKPTTRRRAT
jgi:hypothetical protein